MTNATPEERANLLDQEICNGVVILTESECLACYTHHIAAAVEDAKREERERIAQLESVLRAYERWEADLILDDAAWSTASGMPRLSADIYDELIRIQGLRNKVLGVYQQEPTQ